MPAMDRVRISTRFVCADVSAKASRALISRLMSACLELHPVTLSRRPRRRKRCDGDAPPARLGTEQTERFLHHVVQSSGDRAVSWRRNRSRTLCTTSLARTSSRRMSARISRTWSRRGDSASRSISAASAFERIAPSGWFISWEMVAVSSPSVARRDACASSTRLPAASCSACRRRRDCKSSAPMSAAWIAIIASAARMYARYDSQRDAEREATVQPSGSLEIGELPALELVEIHDATSRSRRLHPALRYVATRQHRQHHLAHATTFGLDIGERTAHDPRSEIASVVRVHRHRRHFGELVATSPGM